MNSIQIIYPYKEHGVWMFDDESCGVNREPFCGDINRMIDAMVEDSGLVAAHRGFMATFSPTPFPQAKYSMHHIRPDGGGHWYEAFGLQGWLCPCMFNYFEAAPENIYISVDSIEDDSCWQKMVNFVLKGLRR